MWFWENLCCFLSVWILRCDTGSYLDQIGKHFCQTWLALNKCSLSKWMYYNLWWSCFLLISEDFYFLLSLCVGYFLRPQIRNYGSDKYLLSIYYISFTVLSTFNLLMSQYISYHMCNLGALWIPKVMLKTLGMLLLSNLVMKDNWELNV